MALTPLKVGVPLDMGQLEILKPRMEQLAVDPVSPVDGQYWYNTVEGIAKVYMDGAIVLFYSHADADKLAAIEIIADGWEDDIQDLEDEVTAISSDNVLSKGEKPAIKLQYDTIIAEQGDIDSLTVIYGITTEKTTYDNAITALTAYMGSLSPAYTDFTTNTVIVGTTFRSKFQDVYTAKSVLLTLVSTINDANVTAATGIAQAAQAAAELATTTSEAALVIIEAIADDGVLAEIEKPAIVQQYNIILGEQAGIHAQADAFVITTELTTYEAAITTLTNYLNGLNPDYDDYSQSTVIVRATFNTNFENVYIAKQALLNKIAEVAKEAGDTAAIIAASKKRHFVAEPTTPYEVGDLWSNAVDLYRCITEKLTGPFNAAHWEVATHYDKTKTIIDGGLVTTGRVEVGGGALGVNNAGMNGSVSGTPLTDIRFWAGADYANRATAPWRVQNDGTFYATQGFIGGWHIDSDSIHIGTKVSGDGYAANAGEVTLKSDGSFHAKNFYINDDGYISIAGITSFKVIPDSYVGIAIQGGHIWENEYDNDEATLNINWYGYQKGYTKYRNTLIGDGKGGTLIHTDGSTKQISNMYPVTIGTSGSVTTIAASAILDLQSTTKALLVPRMTLVQARALRDSGSPLDGMIIFVTNWSGTGQFAGYINGDFYNFTMDGTLGS